MQITLLYDVRGTNATAHTVTWPELISSCQNATVYPSKADCPLIKLATFGNLRSQKGSIRFDGNVTSVSGVEGDYDGEVVGPFEALAALAKAEITALIYTSPSHTPDKPRWRVLAPLSRECDPKSRREFVGRINGALGGILAAESFTLSQSFYVGRVAGAVYECFYVDGVPVDLAVNVTPIFPQGVNHSRDAAHARIATEETLAELESALATIPADDYHEWVSVGQALSELGDVGMLLWLSWSSKSAKHDVDADVSKWDTFTGDRTGFASVFAKAQRYGWVNPKARPPIDTSVVFGVNGQQPVSGTPGAIEFQGGFAGIEEQRQLFAGCTYVFDVNQVLVPGGWLLDRQRFDVHFGGFIFTMDHANSKTEKSAFTALTQSQSIRCQRAHSVCFRPEIAPGAIVNLGVGDKTLVNMYWPVETPSVEGDVTPFLLHMEKLLPDPRDRLILMSYMAACVQYVGVKFQWAPVLQGVMGNGKTFFIECMKEAIGGRYTHIPDSGDIGNKFNLWLRAKLFVGVEEVPRHDKAEVMETLKWMITNRNITVQPKGGEPIATDNRANFMFALNPKDGIPFKIDERRYCPLFTAQQCAADIIRDGMGGDYFPRLYHWARSGGFAHITHYLMSFAIPHELNPATTLHRAPHTSSSSEAFECNLSPVEQEIQDATEQGLPGFSNGWVSLTMLSRMMVHRKLSLRKLSEILCSMGYVIHPHLPAGRTNNSVLPENTRSKLYLRSGHIALNETRPAEISRLYQMAQGIQFNQPGAHHHVNSK